MTDPSDEEMERAERIRKLRTGGARSRGHEMRERRRETAEGAGDAPGDDDEVDEDSSGDEGAAADDDAGAPDGGGAVDDADGGEPATGALSATGDADVLEMAAKLPDEGSLFVVPVREGLRRKFNTVAEQIHLRYGFEYESELDDEQHVRPLALYLGVQTLEDADVEVVKELLESVDVLEAPGDDGQ